MKKIQKFLFLAIIVSSFCAGSAGLSAQVHFGVPSAVRKKVVELKKQIQESRAALTAPVLSDLTSPDSDGSYTVSWNAVNYATGYYLEEDDNALFSSPAVLYSGANTSLNIASKTDGTYYYRVKAVNSFGTSAWSAVESLVVSVGPPQAPVLNSLTSPDTDGNYTVTWNSVDASQYLLEEDDNSFFSSPVTAYSGAGTTLSINGKTDGAYYYRIKGVNSAGSSSWSAAVLVTVSVGLPQTPGLSAFSSPDADGNYTVTWSTVDTIVYFLEEDDNASFTSSSASYTGLNTYLNVTGKTNGTYYYHVRSSNTYGMSSWSTTRSITVIIGPPSAPSINALTSPDGDGAYTVTWAAVNDASGYTLEEDDNSSFTSPSEVYYGAGLSVNLSGKQTGTYYYRLKAVNSNGSSSWSANRFISVNISAPSAPVLSALSSPDSDGNYTVIWSAVNDAASYTLEESTNSGFNYAAEVYIGASTSTSISGKPNGVTYYYRVKAVNSNGSSFWSTTRSVTIVLSAPSAPTLYAFSSPDYDGSFTALWTLISDATGYILEESSETFFSTASRAYIGTSTFTAVARTNGTYYYRVNASNSSGNSPWSTTRSITIYTGLPDTPVLSDLASPDLDGNYTVTWSTAGYSTSYTLEESTYALFNYSSEVYTGTSLTLNTLDKSDTTYYYRVKATNPNGNSSWSATKSVVVALAIPQAPVLYSLASPDTDGTYTVTWGSVSDATGYYLYESTDQAFSTASSVYRTATNYTCSGRANNIYFYRVRGVNSNGNGYWSNTSSMSVTRLPDAPSRYFTTTGDFNGNFQVNWYATTNATGYVLEEDDNSSFTSPTEVYVGVSTFAALSGRVSDTYYYHVKSTNAYGSSSWSSNMTVVVTTAVFVSQLGSSGNDYAFGVAADTSSNIFIAGYTSSDLDGNFSSGLQDLFLTKYNNSGVKQWTRQRGSAANEVGAALAIDASGNLYAAGYTYSSFDGNVSSGNYDAVLVKYDNSGTWQWTKQWGTAGIDCALAVTVDSQGYIYAAGYTSSSLDGNASSGQDDIFVSKFNSSGNRLWTRQRGTSGYDYAYGVAVDSSCNVFLAGYTSGPLDGNSSAGGNDLALVKYSSTGTWEWTKQLGTTALDQGQGAAVDSEGNVYAVGTTMGSIDGNSSSGSSDVFLVKYSNSGVKQWTKQWGSASVDEGYAVSASASGGIYVAGNGNGSIDGNTSAGNHDVFITKYNSAGTSRATIQAGGSGTDYCRGIALDPSGNICVTGYTNGSLDSYWNAGSNDAFLIKFAPLP